MIKNTLSLAIIHPAALLRGQDIAIEPIFFGTHRTAGGFWQVVRSGQLNPAATVMVPPR